MKLSSLGLSIFIALVWCLLATSCSSSTERPTLASQTAEVAASFDGEARGLSPDGSMLFVHRDADGTSPVMCLLETKDGSERFCLDGEVGVGSLAGHAIWSPDGSMAVLPRGEFGGEFDEFSFLDSALIETDSGTPRAVLINRPSTVSLLAFSPSGDRIVVARESGEKDAGRNKVSLSFFDLTTNEPLPFIDVPDGGSTWGDARASGEMVVPDESTVLIGGPSKIFEFDFASGDVSVALDYSSLGPVDPAFGLERERILHPVAALPDGRLLLRNADNFTAYNMTGGRTGYSDGMYVADLIDGSVVPVFTASPETGSWFGPLYGFVAGESQVVVAWLDNSEPSERGNAAMRFSLLDLSTVTLPVDASTLPILWTDDDYDLGSWAGVSTAGTVVMRDGYTGSELLQFVTD